MYGLINLAIQELITSRFGEEKWKEIAAKAGVQGEIIVRLKSYPDDITYKLVGAASEVLGVPGSALLEEFGKFWVTFTASSGYSKILEMAPKTLPGFMEALNDMHVRVGQNFDADLRTPSFWCTDKTENTMVLHYMPGKTNRLGLSPLVLGLIKGLGERFGNNVDALQIMSRDSGNDHDEFLVMWWNGDAKPLQSLQPLAAQLKEARARQYAARGITKDLEIHIVHEVLSFEMSDTAYELEAIDTLTELVETMETNVEVCDELGNRIPGTVELRDAIKNGRSITIGSDSYFVKVV